MLLELISRQMACNIFFKEVSFSAMWPCSIDWIVFGHLILQLIIIITDCSSGCVAFIIYRLQVLQSQAVSWLDSWSVSVFLLLWTLLRNQLKDHEGFTLLQLEFRWKDYNSMVINICIVCREGVSNTLLTIITSSLNYKAVLVY